MGTWERVLKELRVLGLGYVICRRVLHERWTYATFYRERLAEAN